MPSAAPGSAADTRTPRRLALSGPAPPGHGLSGTGHGFAGMVASAAGGAMAPALPAPAGSQAARPKAAAATGVRSSISLARGIPAGHPSTAAGAAPSASARPGPSGKDAGAGPGGLAKVAGREDTASEQQRDGLQLLATALADASLPPAGVGQAFLPQGAPLDAAAVPAATATSIGEGSSGLLSRSIGKVDAKAMLETGTTGGVAPSPASAESTANAPSAGARPSNAAQPATEAAGTASVMDAAQPGGSAAASAPAVPSPPNPVQPSPGAAIPVADGTRTQAGLHPGLSGAAASVEVSPSPAPVVAVPAFAATVQQGAQQPARDRAAGVAGLAATAIRRSAEGASPSEPGDAPAVSAKAAGPGTQPAAGPPATAIVGMAPVRSDAAGAVAATASDAPPLDKGDPAPGTPWPPMMPAGTMPAPVPAPAGASSAADAAVMPHAAPAMPAPDQLGPAFLAAASPAGPSRVVVRLDPAELGLVQVGIVRQPDGPARIELMAERPETLHC